MAEKPVMVMGLDESEHSFYALEWTLDNFFAKSGSDHPFKLVIVHARRTPASVIGVAGPGSGDFITVLETDIKKEAIKTVVKATEVCKKKSVNEVTVEVNEGDPRNVICEAVDKHHASILVVGSHGYGAIKRAVLGSVSDYCTHHAHCTIMIVKKPKN
ncbi:uncharacterized protein LOC107433163 isoform X2 [Ziziphus jujuba]|uniref:Uncharacterized protein LOC107433163 isoform X2 n=1 Tax=Ziziphus jujuba TaxID=326968 RepID=A0A6P4ASR4_ZIZJJ|nr:uncharacterized protein LOC107433163 isoform X2 [Ziziphus jujuba]